MNEIFTVERLVGGAMRITSDSAWLPGGVMVVRSGEQYSLEIPGLGVTTVSRQYNVITVFISIFRILCLICIGTWI